MAKKGTRKGATKTQRRSNSAGRTTGGAKKTAGKRTAGAKKTSAKRAGGAKKTRGKRTSGAKKGGGKRTAAKREMIDTGTDKRYVRRGAAGRFKESDDVSRSLSADVRRKARTKVKSGQGDRGDR